MNKFLLKTPVLTALYCLVALGQGGCINSGAETITVAKVEVSTDTTENELIGKDLASFDYRAIIKERLKISDEEILSGIRWVAGKDEQGTVTFQLVLSGKAKEKEPELNTLFKTFTEEKIDEYRRKIPEMADVETMANYYITLIEKADIDTVWLKISPTFTKFAGKADFDRILKERQRAFKPVGNRKVESRRVSDKLGNDLSGEFYTVTFVYENNDHEEVTMEKIGGQYLLLGYHFVVPDRK